jgi:hypothetical protein
MMNKDKDQTINDKAGSENLSFTIPHLSLEQLSRRLGVYDRQQILIWQRMSPVERLELAFQAYQFALEAVRLTERRRYPDLSEDELKWRVIRRMQGNQHLGREQDARTGHASRTE